MKINGQHDNLTHPWYFVLPVLHPKFLPRIHRHTVAAERLSHSETALAHILLSAQVGSAHALPGSHSTGILPWPQTPARRVLQQVHHQLYSLAGNIDLSYASGPSYKMRLGFRALLTSLCYYVSMLPAFSFIVTPWPCSNLLFFPTSTAVNPNPGCLWLLKPPPMHD